MKIQNQELDKFGVWGRSSNNTSIFNIVGTANQIKGVVDHLGDKSADVTHTTVNPPSFPYKNMPAGSGAKDKKFEVFRECLLTLDKYLRKLNSVSNEDLSGANLSMLRDLLLRARTLYVQSNDLGLWKNFSVPFYGYFGVELQGFFGRNHEATLQKFDDILSYINEKIAELDPFQDLVMEFRNNVQTESIHPPEYYEKYIDEYNNWEGFDNKAKLDKGKEAYINLSVKNSRDPTEQQMKEYKAFASDYPSPPATTNDTAAQSKHKQAVLKWETSAKSKCKKWVAEKQWDAIEGDKQKTEAGRQAYMTIKTPENINAPFRKKTARGAYWDTEGVYERRISNGEMEALSWAACAKKFIDGHSYSNKLSSDATGTVNITSIDNLYRELTYESILENLMRKDIDDKERNKTLVKMLSGDDYEGENSKNKVIRAMDFQEYNTDCQKMLVNCLDEYNLSGKKARISTNALPDPITGILAMEKDVIKANIDKLAERKDNETRKNNRLGFYDEDLTFLKRMEALVDLSNKIISMKHITQDSKAKVIAIVAVIKQNLNHLYQIFSEKELEGLLNKVQSPKPPAPPEHINLLGDLKNFKDGMTLLNNQYMSPSDQIQDASTFHDFKSDLIKNDIEVNKKKENYLQDKIGALTAEIKKFDEHELRLEEIHKKFTEPGERVVDNSEEHPAAYDDAKKAMEDCKSNLEKALAFLKTLRQENKARADFDIDVSKILESAKKIHKSVIEIGVVERNKEGSDGTLDDDASDRAKDAETLDNEGDEDAVLGGYADKDKLNTLEAYSRLDGRLANAKSDYLAAVNLNKKEGEVLADDSVFKEMDNLKSLNNQVQRGERIIEKAAVNAADALKLRGERRDRIINEAEVSVDEQNKNISVNPPKYDSLSNTNVENLDSVTLSYSDDNYYNLITKLIFDFRVRHTQEQSNLNLIKSERSEIVNSGYQSANKLHNELLKEEDAILHGLVSNIPDLVSQVVAGLEKSKIKDVKDENAKGMVNIAQATRLRGALAKALAQRDNETFPDSCALSENSLKSAREALARLTAKIAEINSAPPPGITDEQIFQSFISQILTVHAEVCKTNCLLHDIPSYLTLKNLNDANDSHFKELLQSEKVDNPDGLNERLDQWQLPNVISVAGDYAGSSYSGITASLLTQINAFEEKTRGKDQDPKIISLVNKSRDLLATCTNFAQDASKNASLAENDRRVLIDLMRNAEREADKIIEPSKKFLNISLVRISNKEIAEQLPVLMSLNQPLDELDSNVKKTSVQKTMNSDLVRSSIESATKAVGQNRKSVNTAISDRYHKIFTDASGYINHLIPNNPLDKNQYDQINEFLGVYLGADIYNKEDTEAKKAVDRLSMVYQAHLQARYDAIYTDITEAHGKVRGTDGLVFPENGKFDHLFGAEIAEADEVVKTHAKLAEKSDKEINRIIEVAVVAIPKYEKHKDEVDVLAKTSMGLKDEELKKQFRDHLPNLHKNCYQLSLDAIKNAIQAKVFKVDVLNNRDKDAFDPLAPIFNKTKQIERESRQLTVADRAELFSALNSLFTIKNELMAINVVHQVPSEFKGNIEHLRTHHQESIDTVDRHIDEIKNALMMNFKDIAANADNLRNLISSGNGSLPTDEDMKTVLKFLNDSCPDIPDPNRIPDKPVPVPRDKIKGLSDEYVRAKDRKGLADEEVNRFTSMLNDLMRAYSELRKLTDEHSHMRVIDGAPNNNDDLYHFKCTDTSKLSWDGFNSESIGSLGDRVLTNATDMSNQVLSKYAEIQQQLEKMKNIPEQTRLKVTSVADHTITLALSTESEAGFTFEQIKQFATSLAQRSALVKNTSETELKRRNVELNAQFKQYEFNLRVLNGTEEGDTFSAALNAFRKIMGKDSLVEISTDERGQLVLKLNDVLQKSLLSSISENSKEYTDSQIANWITTFKIFVNHYDKLIKEISAMNDIGNVLFTVPNNSKIMGIRNSSLNEYFEYHATYKAMLDILENVKRLRDEAELKKNPPDLEKAMKDFGDALPGVLEQHRALRAVGGDDQKQNVVCAQVKDDDSFLGNLINADDTHEFAQSAYIGIDNAPCIDQLTSGNLKAALELTTDYKATEAYAAFATALRNFAFAPGADKGQKYTISAGDGNIFTLAKSKDDNGYTVEQLTALGEKLRTVRADVAKNSDGEIERRHVFEKTIEFTKNRVETAHGDNSVAYGIDLAKGAVSALENDENYHQELNKLAISISGDSSLEGMVDLAIQSLESVSEQSKVFGGTVSEVENKLGNVPKNESVKTQALSLSQSIKNHITTDGRSIDVLKEALALARYLKQQEMRNRNDLNSFVSRLSHLHAVDLETMSWNDLTDYRGEIDVLLKSLKEDIEAKTNQIGDLNARGQIAYASALTRHLTDLKGILTHVSSYAQQARKHTIDRLIERDQLISQLMDNFSGILKDAQRKDRDTQHRYTLHSVMKVSLIGSDEIESENSLKHKIGLINADRDVNDYGMAFHALHDLVMQDARDPNTFLSTFVEGLGDNTSLEDKVDALERLQDQLSILLQKYKGCFDRAPYLNGKKCQGYHELLYGYKKDDLSAELDALMKILNAIPRYIDKLESLDAENQKRDKDIDRVIKLMRPKGGLEDMEYGTSDDKDPSTLLGWREIWINHIAKLYQLAYPDNPNGLDFDENFALSQVVDPDAEKDTPANLKVKTALRKAVKHLNEINTEIHDRDKLRYSSVAQAMYDSFSELAKVSGLKSTPVLDLGSKYPAIIQKFSHPELDNTRESKDVDIEEHVQKVVSKCSTGLSQTVDEISEFVEKVQDDDSKDANWYADQIKGLSALSVVVQKQIQSLTECKDYPPGMQDKAALYPGLDTMIYPVDDNNNYDTNLDGALDERIDQLKALDLSFQEKVNNLKTSSYEKRPLFVKYVGDVENYPYNELVDQLKDYETEYNLASAECENFLRDHNIDVNDLSAIDQDLMPAYDAIVDRMLWLDDIRDEFKESLGQRDYDRANEILDALDDTCINLKTQKATFFTVQVDDDTHTIKNFSNELNSVLNKVDALVVAKPAELDKIALGLSDPITKAQAENSLNTELGKIQNAIKALENSIASDPVDHTNKRISPVDGYLHQENSPDWTEGASNQLNKAAYDEVQKRIDELNKLHVKYQALLKPTAPTAGPLFTPKNRPNLDTKAQVDNILEKDPTSKEARMIMRENIEALLYFYKRVKTPNDRDNIVNEIKAKYAAIKDNPAGGVYFMHNGTDHDYSFTLDSDVLQMISNRKDVSNNDDFLKVYIEASIQKYLDSKTHVNVKRDEAVVKREYSSFSRYTNILQLVQNNHLLPTATRVTLPPIKPPSIKKAPTEDEINEVLTGSLKRVQVKQARINVITAPQTNPADYPEKTKEAIAKAYGKQNFSDVPASVVIDMSKAVVIEQIKNVKYGDDKSPAETVFKLGFGAGVPKNKRDLIEAWKEFQTAHAAGSAEKKPFMINLNGKDYVVLMETFNHSVTKKDMDGFYLRPYAEYVKNPNFTVNKDKDEPLSAKHQEDYKNAAGGRTLDSLGDDLGKALDYVTTNYMGASKCIHSSENYQDEKELARGKHLGPGRTTS